MHKRWVLQIHGRPRLLEIDWNLMWTNRGRARVDGIEIARWWRIHNFPGVTAILEIDGVSIEVVRLMTGFDIDLSRSPGVLGIDPPLPPGYSRRTKLKADQDWGILILALVLGLPCFVGLVSLILAWFFSGR